MQHQSLKKQVLKEAQVVKEIDDELSVLIDGHRLRKSWLKRE